MRVLVISSADVAKCPLSSISPTHYTRDENDDIICVCEAVKRVQAKREAMTDEEWELSRDAKAVRRVNSGEPEKWLVPSAECTRCHSHITYYKGLWWSDDDDFNCPDGEERHTA